MVRSLGNCDPKVCKILHLPRLSKATLVGEGPTYGKISWELRSQGLQNPPPPATEKSNTSFVKKREGKTPGEKRPAPKRSRTHLRATQPSNVSAFHI